MFRRIKIQALRLALAATTVAALSTSAALAADNEEGGYAGTRTEGHGTVVYNFLKHFRYEQYYYAAGHQWTWNNDNRVDNMDISIFGGHGNRWFIRCEDGVGVDLSSAGTHGDLGYGDQDAEFVAFESCKVVPSPLEVTDWATNWTRTGGIFDGLHQAVGFRTDSYQSTDEDVSDYFGNRVRNNHAIWQSWFDAIDHEGRSNEFGSAVMYPPAENDTYASFCADPPRDHTWLRIWWQY